MQKWSKIYYIVGFSAWNMEGKTMNFYSIDKRYRDYETEETFSKMLVLSITIEAQVVR